MAWAILQQHGLSEDPFEFTNADQEPRLTTYFVAPPYFSTVLGTPTQPQSHVVFAPRGGGKSAQRRMIELEIEAAGEALCVTYDEFDQPPGLSTGSVTWTYHVHQICRSVLVAVLITLEQDASLSERLSAAQKQILKFQVNQFLGGLSIQEFKEAIHSVKSLGDKASDFWHKYSGPIALMVSAVMKKFGLDDVDLPSELARTELSQDENLRYHYNSLLEIAISIGYKSTYVLVDRVDETALTAADSHETFKFIEPLVTDLPTLEAPGVAFKFFLWDQIEPEYRASGTRPDRVGVYTLRWSVAELSRMLSERLRSYSDGAVSSLNDLLYDAGALDLHMLSTHLASGSPRDMIRFCKRVLAEQTRVDPDATCVDIRQVWAAVRGFSEDRAQELAAGHLPDLRRIGQPTFTTSYVGSDVFRISDNAARRKLQIWGNAGIVAKIGEIPNPPNRPLYLYGVTDLRVGIAALAGEEVELVLGNYCISCPSCARLLFNDRPEITCPNCGQTFALSEASTLLELCSRV